LHDAPAGRRSALDPREVADFLSKALQLIPRRDLQAVRAVHVAISSVPSWT
jgi:hypothetical protein